MMRTGSTRSRRGFTIVELLVAVLIFSMVAAALAQNLIVAEHARRTSARWMQATQLAEERLERLRAGDRGHDAGPIGMFTRVWQARKVPGYARLERVEVTIAWEDRGPQEFTLTALIRIPS